MRSKYIQYTCNDPIHVITLHCRLVQRETHKPCRPYLLDRYVLGTKKRKWNFLYMSSSRQTVEIKVDLNTKCSLTTTSISGVSPVHTDGRLSACQGIRLHAGTFNVDIRCEADINHTRIVVDLWWDFFVAFLKHPECTLEKTDNWQELKKMWNIRQCFFLSYLLSKMSHCLGLHGFAVGGIGFGGCCSLHWGSVSSGTCQWVPMEEHEV